MHINTVVEEVGDNNNEDAKEENVSILDNLEKVTDMETQGEEPRKPKLWKRIYGFGIMLTIVKIVIDGVISLAIKKFDNIDPLVLVFYRSLVNLSIILPLSVYKDQPAFPSGQSLKDRLCLIFRGVIGCINIMAQFYAYQNLPLGDTKMILASKPAFVTISARIFLKEHCGIFEIFNIIIMMVGVIFVLKPPFIFTAVANVEYNSEGLKAGIILFIVVAMASNNTVILRHLRKSSTITLILSRELIFAVESFIFVMLFNSMIITPSWEQKVKIVGIGVSALVANLLNLVTLKLEEASKLSLIDKSGGIIMAFVLQVIFFNEVPGLYTSVGIALVSFSIILVGIKKIFCDQTKVRKDETMSSMQMAQQ